MDGEHGLTKPSNSKKPWICISKSKLHQTIPRRKRKFSSADSHWVPCHGSHPRPMETLKTFYETQGFKVSMHSVGTSNHWSELRTSNEGPNQMIPRSLSRTHPRNSGIDTVAKEQTRGFHPVRCQDKTSEVGDEKYGSLEIDLGWVD